MSVEEPGVTVNGTIPTPFRCIIVGPSGSGKSTFVRDLVRNEDRLFSKTFDYLYIFTGTPKENDDVFRTLENDTTVSHPVKIFDVNKLYLHVKNSKKGGGRKNKTANDDDDNVSVRHDDDGDDDSSGKVNLEDTDFSSHLMALLKSHRKLNQEGCIVFDDLMDELADCGILTKLFSKISRHFLVSVIHVTQNLFHKGHGKKAGSNVTVFRNNQVLVMFRSPMDNSIFSLVAQRLRTAGSSKQLSEMLRKICEKYEYVMIVPGSGSRQGLEFRSDIFASEPIPHQKIFSLPGSEEAGFLPEKKKKEKWLKRKKAASSENTLLPIKKKRALSD